MDIERRERRTILSGCLLVLTLICCVLPARSISSRRHLVCKYYHHRYDSAEYRINNIPTDLCTHVVFYASLLDFPWENDMEHGLMKDYQKFGDIKNRQPEVKLLMHVSCLRDFCGSNSNDTQKVLIESAIRFLRQYNLDGIMYVLLGRTGALSQYYATLIEKTKKAFKNAGHDTWTVSVDVREKHLDDNFELDPQRICGAADFVFINVERQYRNDHTDISSPLYRRYFDSADDRNNIMDATQNLINNGCSRDKILLSVAFVGRMYELANATDHGVNAVTNEKYLHLMEYNEICPLLQEAGWTFDWDEQSKAPFAYRGKQWITYENEASLEEKANFVDRQGLGGLAVIALHYDDYKGVCGNKHPLLTALWEAYQPTWSTDGDPFTFAIFRTTKRPN